jgi:hypothetical protein
MLFPSSKFSHENYVLRFCVRPSLRTCYQVSRPYKLTGKFWFSILLHVDLVPSNSYVKRRQYNGHCEGTVLWTLCFPGNEGTFSNKRDVFCAVRSEAISRGPSIFPIFSSERMLHKGYDRKDSVEKKLLVVSLKEHVAKTN